MSLTVLIGGARSGKSSLAVEIGQRFDERTTRASETAGDGDGGADVTFIATAAAFDGDMAARIDRHRAERPAHWSTVEEQIELAAAISAAPAGLVIVDCLTLWTSNLIWADHSDEVVRDLATAAADAAAQRIGPVVTITNEVGLGIVPDNELARRYRDVHGWVNQQWVRSADRALHLVAGKAMPLVDPWTLLDDVF
jgi:adenosylcobinamide kinase/adenosylcobinamide-phosphate guanylyltransferase